MKYKIALHDINWVAWINMHKEKECYDLKDVI